MIFKNKICKGACPPAFRKSELWRGFGMIEVVVGATVISLVAFSAGSVAQTAMKLSSENSNNNKAVFLIEEGVEAVKIMRDGSWQNINSLTAGTDYFLNFNGTNWATTTTNTFIDGLFERKFVMENISRDNSSKDIVASGSSGSYVDTGTGFGTKKLTVSVSWVFRNATTTKSVSTYITNMF